jgi:hypothetical protein
MSYSKSRDCLDLVVGGCNIEMELHVQDEREEKLADQKPHIHVKSTASTFELNSEFEWATKRRLAMNSGILMACRYLSDGTVIHFRQKTETV